MIREAGHWLVELTAIAFFAAVVLLISAICGGYHNGILL